MGRMRPTDRTFLVAALKVSGY